jgi:hypothetical protein
VNDPIGIYSSKKIAVYRSFEEENEATYTYYAGLSPLECMQQLNYLLKQTYGADFGPEKTLGRKIYFD